MKKWGEPHTAYSERGPMAVSPAGASPHRATAGWIEVRPGEDFPAVVGLSEAPAKTPSSLPAHRFRLSSLARKNTRGETQRWQHLSGRENVKNALILQFAC